MDSGSAETHSHANWDVQSFVTSLRRKKQKAQDEVDTDFSKVEISLEFMSKNSIQIKGQL